MDRAKLATQLNIDEGRRKKIYKDTVGKVTGGVGHNFDDKPIPEDVIDLLLSHDINDAINDLDRALPWWNKLSAARQEALCNMCFNMGIVRLMQFKNMLAALQRGDYERAATEALDSVWAKQVGERAVRIAGQFRRG